MRRREKCFWEARAEEEEGLVGEEEEEVGKGKVWRWGLEEEAMGRWEEVGIGRVVERWCWERRMVERMGSSEGR